MITTPPLKRLRKSLPEIRTLVAQQLNKLMKKAAECRADGLVDGAGQCLAAYIQLRDVYKLQFEQVVGLEGFASGDEETALEAFRNAFTV